MQVRRYFGESLAWILAFVLTVEFAAWLAGRFEPGSPLRLVALVPVLLALAAGFWVELRLIARMDELQRLTYLVATLAGSMTAVLFCAVAYLGEVLQVWARVAPIYAIAAMGVGFGLGWLGARRHYG